MPYIRDPQMQDYGQNDGLLLLFDLIIHDTLILDILDRTHFLLTEQIDVTQQL